MATKPFISSKRGPPAPLSGPSSSSEGEGSDHEDIPPSPCSSTASEPTYERLPGFSHHGHEVVVPKAPKPRNGTTKVKKRVKRHPAADIGGINAATTQQNFVREENGGLLNTASNRARPKKDPLPMKLRALPQSFWQQPNSMNTMSPGNIYLPVLPPLCKSEHSNLDPSEIRPISPASDEDKEKLKAEDHNYSTPEGCHSQKTPLCLNNNNNSNNVVDRNIVDPVAMETTKGKSPLSSPRDHALLSVKDPQDNPSPVVVRRKIHAHPSPRILKVSPASQELLRKLFEGVEREKSTKKPHSGPRKIRARQDPKISTATVTTGSKHLIRDSYMINAVTDGLLPMLSLETSKQSTAPSSQLSLVALKSGDKTLTLPSLSVEQNYPAVLSELVKAL